MKRTRINPVSPKQKIELALRAKLKQELIEEFGYRCMTCGKVPYLLDLSHIVRLGRGGKTTKENCILECRACHDARDQFK